MAKLKDCQLEAKEKEKYIKDFYEMVSKLKNKKEVEGFFHGLFTPSEIVMISRRIQIARMILSGSGYEVIREKISAGNATITQIDKWLNNTFKGYRKILEKYKKKNHRKKGGVYIPDDFPDTFDGLRKRYPGHFWLINLLLNKKDLMK